MLGKPWKYVAATIIILIAPICLVLNCSRIENSASQPTNAAPIVNLADVPIENSDWQQNPIVKWYATDTDGNVTTLRYVVKKCELIPDLDRFIEMSQRDRFIGWEQRYVDSQGESAAGEIPIPADFVSGDCLDCYYALVVAEDNLGTYSIVDYRRISRGEHPPGTIVRIHPDVHIDGTCCDCADEISHTGVIARWYGVYNFYPPHQQPRFDYSWEFYGPFGGYTDAQGAHPDTAGVSWEQHLVDSSWNDMTDSRWIQYESMSFRDLFSDDQSHELTITGYFVFKVRARDGDFDVDQTPAVACFEAVQPRCERGILLIDMTRYGLPGPGSLYDGGMCPSINAAEDIYHPHFKSVVERALGDTIDSFYFAWSQSSSSPPPPVELYAQFKLIIILAEDAWNGTNSSWLTFMARYMDMGGNVMLMGVDHFAWTDFLHDPPHMEYFSTNSVAYKYFNVQGQFLANWFSSLRLGEPNEEFIEGMSMVPDMPNVCPDSSQLAYYIAPGHMWCRGDDPYPYYQNAIPGVNFFVTGGSAEGVYLAVSAYGAEGMIDGGLCGLRYETECFKSAVFGFPLWPLHSRDATMFMRGMINWFDIQ